MAKDRVEGQAAGEGLQWGGGAQGAHPSGSVWLDALCMVEHMTASRSAMRTSLTRPGNTSSSGLMSKHSTASGQADSGSHQGISAGSLMAATATESPEGEGRRAEVEGKDAALPPIDDLPVVGGALLRKGLVEVVHGRDVEESVVRDILQSGWEWAPRRLISVVIVITSGGGVIMIVIITIMIINITIITNIIVIIVVTITKVVIIIIISSSSSSSSSSSNVRAAEIQSLLLHLWPVTEYQRGPHGKCGNVSEVLPIELHLDLLPHRGGEHILGLAQLVSNLVPHLAATEQGFKEGGGSECKLSESLDAALIQRSRRTCTKKASFPAAMMRSPAFHSVPVSAPISGMTAVSTTTRFGRCLRMYSATWKREGGGGGGGFFQRAFRRVAASQADEAVSSLFLRALQVETLLMLIFPKVESPEERTQHQAHLSQAAAHSAPPQTAPPGLLRRASQV